MRYGILIWLGILAATAAPAATLTPAKDNTLYESASGSLSNGSGQSLFAGRTSGGDRRRALVAFDLSSIPAEAQISRVALTLTLSKTNSASGTQTLALRRVLNDWGEGSSNAGDPGGNGTAAAPGDATWLHTASSTAFWVAPGGDFSTTPSASQSVAGTGSYTWESAQLLADVQDWIASPAGNHGWILLGDEVATATAKRFASREASTPALRPKLTVEYTMPTTPVQANTPPTMAAISDQVVDQNGVAGPIAVEIGDAETSADSLTLSARSDNDLLLPPAGIALTGSGTRRSLILTPATGRSGSTRLSLILADGSDSTSQSFALVVNPLVVQLVGDFDGDLSVGFDDFFLFADHFGETASSPGWNARYDLDASNGIDFDDFFLFADHFGDKGGA